MIFLPTHAEKKTHEQKSVAFEAIARRHSSIQTLSVRSPAVETFGKPSRFLVFQRQEQIPSPFRLLYTKMLNINLKTKVKEHF